MKWVATEGFVAGGQAEEKGAGPRRWRRAVTGVLLLLAIVFVGSASASPGAGVVATVVGSGTLRGHLRIATRGATNLVFQEVTIAPGGHTGWHRHPGTLLVVVKSGTLTRVTADCRAHTYTAGLAFVETSGVHEGRNLDASVPVELLVTGAGSGRCTGRGPRPLIAPQS
jgi:quercetin dioxygenase-like cupin family protein